MPRSSKSLRSSEPLQSRSRTSLVGLLLIIALLHPPTISALHHMKRAPVHWVNRRADTKPVVVTNNCEETIYPGIQTQAGDAPPTNGFKLSPGDTKSQSVSADWQGRVWARTNCSFNSAGTASASGSGKACLTGDCGGTIACFGTGEIPASLAEFTLQSASGQTFYDISLVDGYNIPMGIKFLQGDNSSLDEIPPNLTNPICIGTAALLTAQGDTSDALFGTNASFPLPLDQSASSSDVEQWCPWELQLQPPSKPGDGVYPYPDDDIQRPAFNPCVSACAKWSKPSDCCTGKYNSPSSCQPSDYSKKAKIVCPDAYSFAFDDQTSTFILPSGGGFEIVFCPTGRSTTILTTLADELFDLAATGRVSTSILADSQNMTIIKTKNSGQTLHRDWTDSLLVLVGVIMVGIWSNLGV